MKHIKRFILTCCSSMLILSMLSIGGCGAKSAPVSLNTPTVSPEPEPTKQPVAGGELLIPIPQNPLKTEEGISATPLLVTTEEMVTMYGLIFEPLIRCTSTNRLTPSLAEKWECDDTGRVWTIHLRQGVTWHDGKNFTADDVMATVTQLEELGSASYYYEDYQMIETVEELDHYCIQITMKKPGQAALYALTFPIISEQGATEHWIGTGPYRVVNTSNSVIELTTNESWWKQSPYITTVTCLARDNNDVALASYEAGQLNMVHTFSVTSGKYREEGATNVMDIMTQQAEMLLVNHDSSILSDLKVRQAIAHALDRSMLTSSVYMNRASVCDVPVPADSFLYDPSSKLYDYDQHKALALLEEAGWKDVDEDGVLEWASAPGQELKLTLLVNESTENTYRKSVANLIASQLAEIGMQVEVVTAKYSLTSSNSDFVQKLQNKEFDLALAGFHLAKSGDVSAYIHPNGARNYGGYAGTKLNATLQKALQAKDTQAFIDNYAIFQQEFVQELPFIMLYFRMSSVVYDADIKNVSDIRQDDILRTIEKWYMEEA